MTFMVERNEDKPMLNNFDYILSARQRGYLLRKSSRSSSLNILGSAGSSGSLWESIFTLVVAKLSQDIVIVKLKL